jgi:phosphopantothenoylcysteine decarboxylase/phosphopantothenate--cysteine ligase
MADPKPRMLITAGPTHEPIDAVRYLANRSSGAMGLALAAAGRDAGFDVTLLLGPTPTEPPAGPTVARFGSSRDLQRLLEKHFAAADVLIMAAAVADYRPARSVEGKLRRTGGAMTLELEPVPDLVAGCAAAKRRDQRIIAYALEEPDALERRAGEKLRRKRVDAIVANPLQTMGAADVDATLFTATGERLRPGPMSKPAFAEWLVRWLSASPTTPR